MVNADVDECTESRNVGHDAFQRHSRRQIGHLLDSGSERRGLELGSWIATWFLELGDDVGDGGDTEAVVRELPWVQASQQRAVADHLAHADACGIDDSTYDGIRLRMHARSIQRVVTAGDAEEPCTLLEGLRAEPRDVFELGAARERTVLVSMGHNALRE